MAHFSTTIQTPGLDVSAAFAYLADFSSAQEWDPGVAEASRDQDGALEVGSSFTVVADFMGRQIPLTYAITELVQDERVVLRAENNSVISLDTLTFVSTSDGAAVTYDAELTGKGAMRLAGPLLQLLFNRIGGKAQAGLQQHLAALVRAG